MKRIKNSDINFKINPKKINLNNFSMRFFTVNSQAYFFIKNQDNLVSVERDATIYDEDVIISGGTKVLDYYLPLDWSELVQLGEGVLNYRCINNIEDPYFPDMTYNQVVEDTTGYYINSDIHVDPSEDRNLIERVSELESALAVESIDRDEADTFISGAVDTEIARAISAETELSERIENLESGTSEALDAEIERATNAENALRQDLTDESEIRSSADTAIWTAVNGEITRASSAETAIDNKIDVESLRAIGVENSISGNLETYKATNNAAVQAEITRATSAETSLGNAIDNEVTARTNADAALGTRIDNLTSASTAAIEAEENRAKAAEASITNALNNEVIRATSAETQLSNSLNAEISRATSAETAVDNKIDAETLRATSAEDALSARIDVLTGVTDVIYQETIRASRAEEALSGAIDSVSAITSGNVEALDAKIDTVSGNVITETTRATNAENALGGRIDAEEARAKGVEDVLSGAIDTLDVRFFDDAKYENSGNTKVINFYNGNVVKATIDATDFVKDGMISTVELIPSGSTSVLVITWNTDGGSKVTTIDIGDIFEADNYYQKSETSGKTEIANALALKLNIADFNTYSAATDTVINSKAAQTIVDALSGTVTAHTSDNVIHVTSTDKEKWNKVDNKVDESAFTTHITDSTIHLTSGDVLSLIDGSISGKANSSDVYLKTETSGKTEIATALDAKLDASAYTVDVALDSNSTNPIQNQALYDELRIVDEPTETTLTFRSNRYTNNYPAGCTEIKIDANAPSKSMSINVFASNRQIGSFTISTNSSNNITVRTYLEYGDATYSISGTVVTISYPDVTNVTMLEAVNSQKTFDVTAVTYATPVVLKDQVSANTAAIETKQDILSAGANITISGNVISAEMEDTYVSGITVESVGGVPTPPSVIADGYVKVTWGDDYTQTYSISDLPYDAEHYYDEATKYEFGNFTNETINSAYRAASDDCYRLNTVIFNGSCNFSEDSSWYTSMNQLQAVYFYAPSPTAIILSNYSEDFLKYMTDTCDSYDTVEATYPIYVADLAAYSNAILYNNVTWSQHFGNRLQQIPSSGGNEHVLVLSYNDPQKESISIPTSAITVDLNDRISEDEEVTAAALNILNERVSEDEEVTAAALNSLEENKQDVLSAGTGINITDNVISVTGGTDGISSAQCQSMINSSISGKTNQSDFTAHTANTSIHLTTGNVQTQISNSISGKTNSSDFTAHTASTTVHTTSAEKTSWNGAATNASNAITALGGLSIMKLTQAQYDALSTKDNSTLYVIVG